MRWKGRRQSSNIEDRRGVRLSNKVKGGGIGAIVIALVAMCFGVITLPKRSPDSNR